MLKERCGEMASLDWSQCPAVESVPGRLSGAWVFRDTRIPVSIIFENLEYGASLDEIQDNYDVTLEQIQMVLDFAARSASSMAAAVPGPSTADAHPV